MEKDTREKTSHLQQGALKSIMLQETGIVVEGESKKLSEEVAKEHMDEVTNHKQKARDIAYSKTDEKDTKNKISEANKKVEEDVKKQADEEAKNEKEQEAKQKAEEESKKKAEEEAKQKAEQEIKKQAEEEEAKRKKEQDAKQKVEEEIKKAEAAKKKTEQEAKKRAEEEDKKKVEEEAKKQAEEKAKKQADEEVKKKKEQEAKQKSEEEIKKKAETAQKRAEQTVQKMAEEDAKKKFHDGADRATKEKIDQEQNKKTRNGEKNQTEDEAKATAKGSRKDYRQEELTQNTKRAETSTNKTEKEATVSASKSTRTEAEAIVDRKEQAEYEIKPRVTPNNGDGPLNILLTSFQELLLEIKRIFVTEHIRNEFHSVVSNVKSNMMASKQSDLGDDLSLKKHLHFSIEHLLSILSKHELKLYSSATINIMESSVLQTLDLFEELLRHDNMATSQQFKNIASIHKSIVALLADIRQCIYQKKSATADTDTAACKTVVELQLLQKDIEYIKLNTDVHRDVTSRSIESYFGQVCETLTLLHSSIVATVDKPNYSTSVNLLLPLVPHVHDVVQDLPARSVSGSEIVTPGLRHSLRQLYRVVSSAAQQHSARVRNEREVAIVEEIRRHLLALDRGLKSFLDLCSKTETQKELLETIRKNLNTLKADARNFRAQCPVSALPEKDDLLLAAFELVIERLALNPLQLDSIDYLRLLGDSLAQFSGLMRRLSAGPAVSDWLLRYQLQLLKIFDTIEFCLSEEQFIVIGSKEKYCKTSTQEAIHAAKQLITHYKITSEQNASTRKESDQSRHIQRQGLTDTVNHTSSSEVRSSSQATAQRAIHEGGQRRPHSQHHLAGRHARTRSPLSFTDEYPDRTPRSSSRCSLGALPSKRGPSFAVYLKNVFIERDHGFKLLCVVLDAEIDVRWTKDAIELLPSARYRIQQKNGLITLQVEHADYEDSGVYACHVFNNYGQSFNKCTVEVYDTSDDIICPSFSIPRNMDHRSPSASRQVTHYTDKTYLHQLRSTGRSSAASLGYDRVKARDSYGSRPGAERHPDYGWRQQFSSEARSLGRRSAGGQQHVPPYRPAGRDVTAALEASRQRRGYYHDLMKAKSVIEYRQMMRDRVQQELRQSPSVPEPPSQGLSTTGRDWARRRPSPSVGEHREEYGSAAAQSRITQGSMIECTSTREDSKTVRDTTRHSGVTRLASPRSGTTEGSPATELLAAATANEPAGGKRSQTFPYHYRMDTFSTPQRYDSLGSLQMYQPIVQTVLRDRMVKRGSNLLLVCSFWGVNCAVEWVHNFVKIGNSAKYRVSRHQGMSLLEIYDITHHEAGMYKCVVRNDCGEDVTNCCILVLDHIRLSSTKHTRTERRSLARRF
ncbi:plectin-like [Anopheles bellator]|uniref:plectin-like n=1 Tax=Anopheles bellator TaxID=139047 RepID=UPI002647DCBC|nr:plectin-like [Anopheles bellator]